MSTVLPPVTPEQAAANRALLEAELREYHRARRKPRDLEPCGTPAAYRRHERNGEVPCARCCAARAGKAADRRQAARKPPAVSRVRQLADRAGEYAWLRSFGIAPAEAAWRIRIRSAKGAARYERAYQAQREGVAA